ncbi:hypothetical protein WCQ02_29220 [Paraburkholderia tropica]|uniref:hypothetical protein n=1 Tax=Paraburkholderia tropica TaxID=92647 RepID=UPI00301B448D
MNVSVNELGFKLDGAQISPESVCYRPPHWPPPPDWIVSEDANGNPLSLWGSPYWDFSAWAGYAFRLDFAGGRSRNGAPPLSPKNQQLMRVCATWLIWGPQGAISWTSLKSRFLILRRLVALCDREGVPISRLTRFPHVLQQVAGLYSAETERNHILLILDRLRLAEDRLGLQLLDESSISKLSESFARTSEEGIQTAYIPVRIWSYQICRLRECLDDFLLHLSQIQECFHFCIDAYAHNFGSLEAALLATGRTDRLLPFAKQPKEAGQRSGRRYFGKFELTACRFGIDPLLRKWAAKADGNYDVRQFSTYLSLVQLAGLAYIANFTLQRKEEVCSLRADCLIWEQIPVVGLAPIIRGETTKTDPDSDARWPTSPSVEVAVRAMTAVANMRLRCAAAIPEIGCSDYDKANPYLYSAVFEPWATGRDILTPYSTRPTLQTYGNMLKRYPRLFDETQLRIIEEDLVIARKFTPNLTKDEKFSVGNVWPLAYHQLRRTGAVNMFASGYLCESSIQVIMKHSTVLQTRYYGKNYSHARFNEEYERVTVAARYEVMAREIEAVVEDRYVSPLGEERKREIVVNLVSAKDFDALVRAGQKGEVSFRQTRLGGCTKQGHCDYGGIESIARCTGGDGDKPCREAIYDKNKQGAVEQQLARVEGQITQARPSSPRAKALQAEANGLRNYLNAIRK